MNTKKIIKYILIAIPLLFLAKWGIETVIYDSNKIPDINPHPTQKVRIHGKFPFENDVNMKIAILYINKNPKCDRKLWIAGTQFPHVVKKTFSTDIKKQSYESMVNLDYFATGVCQWEAHQIYAYLESKKNNIAVLGESVARVKKGTSVSWESNWEELYEDGKIIWDSDLLLFEKIGRSKADYERLFPKKVHFPANIQIGTIDYQNLSSSDETFDLECVKQKSDNNKTLIICNGYDKNKVVNVTGYDWKLNISSLQKEIKFSFIDKGWIK